MIASLMLAAAIGPLTSPPPATQPAVTDPAAFVAQIETAHGGADVYYAKPAIKAQVVVEFGGAVRHDGPMWYLPPAHVTRLESGGQTIVFDGETCHVAPAAEADPSDRFAALTWPYFFAAPFKLDDDGVTLADGGMQPLTGDPQPTISLTFGDGVGDAPDDWYLVWKNDDGSLAALAYIVTFGGGPPEPHVALYSDYVDVGGNALPTKLTFYDWSPEKGVFGDPLGVVTVASYEVVDPPAGAFEAPEGSVEVPLP
ncbi:MAG: hypothetical protein AAGD32_01260 [Planctomycetota bacterium]